MTHGHDWAIFVNPVGHDAAVKFFNARCSAAGYRWNPTLIQLADPKDTGYYQRQCGKGEAREGEILNYFIEKTLAF